MSKITFKNPVSHPTDVVFTLWGLKGVPENDRPRPVPSGRERVVGLINRRVGHLEGRIEVHSGEHLRFLSDHAKAYSAGQVQRIMAEIYFLNELKRAIIE